LTTTKSSTKALSQKQIAESDASLWSKLKEQQIKLQEKMKEVVERLHNYAADHREDFAGKNTLKIGDVKLVFSNEGKVVTGKAFDINDFAGEYGECVESKVKLSALKGIMISERLAEEIHDNFDISIEYSEVFKVEKA
jgi:hypothetical protein